MAAPAGVVCVGASAGGVEALREFAGGFDSSFRGSVLVVLHIAPTAGSALDRILARSTSIGVTRGSDGEPLEAARMYVATPDHHLIVADGRLRLSHGPRENGVRPAVDPLFRSAAHAFGERSVAVVLSGTGDDGASGLGLVRRLGGMTLVQDPESAAYREMPARAIEAVEVDVVASPAALAASAVARVNAFGERAQPAADDEEGSTRVASEYVCPDCGGTLYLDEESGVERFVCRVGHSYSPKTLLERQDEQIENVLWSAVRAFDEHADLARRMMDRMRRSGLERSAARYRDRIEESRSNGERLREFLTREREDRELAEG